MKPKKIAFVLIASILCININAQQLTKDQIMAMSIEQLSELPLEDLMQAVETLGVSSVDELFALIMNKNVSSASKEEEDSFVSPLSTTVITKAEMRSYGISTIEEAFRLIPGMIVTEKANGIYDIQMRGLSNIPDNNMLLYTENANTLVMVDGRQIRNSIMGSLTMEMIPVSIEDVDRIEVVRGACGALYGANAVNGVINIITDKPNTESSTIMGNMQMGNNNTYIGDVALRGSWLDGKISAGATFNIQNRGRSTDKLYVMPNPKQYVVNDDLADITRSADLYGNIDNGYLTHPNGTKIDIANNTTYIPDGAWLSTKEIDNLRLIVPTAKPLSAVGITNASPDDIVYISYNSLEPETQATNMFHNANIARKTFGVNGYLSFIPNKDIKIDLSMGYGESTALSTQINAGILSFNERNGKNGYINLNSHIYGLSLNYGYEFGPQDYAYGVPGYKIWHNMMNGSIEYSFKLSNLSIKTAIDYQWAKYTDYLPVFNDENYAVSGNYTWHYEKDAPVPDDNHSRLYGFLNGSKTLYAIAPSVRLDYKIGGVRLIGAFRSDKTNTPDKWNHSWQLAANYSINDNNFIRIVYGRANRGANLINTSINHQWLRTNMQPQREVYVGNANANLMKIDNVELGYRWKPIESILVDAELFYSRSTDYGSMMSQETMMAAELSQIQSVMTEHLPQVLGAYYAMKQQELPEKAIQAALNGMSKGAASALSLESRTYTRYGNLPYKVNQFGLSCNIDWIISPKLIAKLNANVQQTTINNYYKYSQTAQYQTQLSIANTTAQRNLFGDDNIVNDIVHTLIGYSTTTEDAIKLLYHMIAEEPIDSYKQSVGWDSMNETEQQALLNELYEAGVHYESYNGVQNPLTLYYGLKYNVVLKGNEMYFGSSYAEAYQTSNGHKHKATPTIYGMIGLIYKPIAQINVSAFGNFIGRRTFDTQYGSTELGNRFTLNMKVGYSPATNLEVFVNAHNLFNNEQREFVYCDRLGGLYTLGVNFKF